MGDDDKRSCFDFEIDFCNGGGLQGQEFRLDIDGDDISDQALADEIVRDLRLLMVAEVRILHKRIVRERHKRSVDAGERRLQRPRFIDLSHSIESGMITYRGLPAPLICDHLGREQSRAHYAPGTEFQIDQLTMVGNTGTYLDSPFHRHPDGIDLAGLPLDSLAELDAVLVRADGASGRAIGREAFLAHDVRDKAVLVDTKWSRHWRTDRYFEGHPFLTEGAAAYLRDAGARLVGIDSLNIDDTDDGRRPVHTTLLGADIPIVEHLCRLDLLPTDGFRFTAVPAKVQRMGTFPVRAYATVPG